MKRRMFIVCVAVLVVALLSVPLRAESAGAQRRTPVVTAFEKNKDAVVSISSKTVREVVSNDIFGRGWEWPFRRRQMVIPSLGSGFIINANGYIVTNAHVVRRAEEITVVMADNSKYKARKIAEESRLDLALLKIDSPEPLPIVTLGHSDDLMIGETVLAIGNPFGYQQTLTDGILSAIHRDVELSEGSVLAEMLQISAPINPGNSGGPLLNINGEVIGINTAIRKAAQGIGFAIPIDQLRENLPKMINIERLRRIDFGLAVSNRKQSVNRPGIQVTSIRSGSAAEKAGLHAGDIITYVDNKAVDSAIDFHLDMLEREAGTTVTFQVRKGGAADSGRSRNVTMSLLARPRPDAKALAKRLFGMEVASLTASTIHRYNLSGNPGDVVVMKVEKASPAYYGGIEPGDILIALDGGAVENIEQLAYKFETLENDKQVTVLYSRTQKRGGYLLLLRDTATLRPRSNGRAADSTKKHIDL